ncbi:hypothetical protein [Polaromonas sp. CG_9.11]|uniref:hypothetical protein n=1 Tax=Polaromonas sp. CG_9.11 TaxID=2787730 RepID=UPI0018C8F092|nr:hypothetical protein [Polaromonas sp. CG_9.11]MBG6076423.1 hypothetical protein [Polaromonas sp. CG_9.11]
MQKERAIPSTVKFQSLWRVDEFFVAVCASVAPTGKRKSMVFVSDENQVWYQNGKELPSGPRHAAFHRHRYLP